MNKPTLRLVKPDEPISQSNDILERIIHKLSPDQADRLEAHLKVDPILGDVLTSVFRTYGDKLDLEKFIATGQVRKLAGDTELINPTNYTEDIPEAEIVQDEPLPTQYQPKILEDEVRKLSVESKKNSIVIKNAIEKIKKEHPAYYATGKPTASVADIKTDVQPGRDFFLYRKIKPILDLVLDCDLDISMDGTHKVELKALFADSADLIGTDIESLQKFYEGEKNWRRENPTKKDLSMDELVRIRKGYRKPEHGDIHLFMGIPHGHYYDQLGQEFLKELEILVKEKRIPREDILCYYYDVDPTDIRAKAKLLYNVKRYMQLSKSNPNNESLPEIPRSKFQGESLRYTGIDRDIMGNAGKKVLDANATLSAYNEQMRSPKSSSGFDLRLATAKRFLSDGNLNPVERAFETAEAKVTDIDTKTLEQTIREGEVAGKIQHVLSDELKNLREKYQNNVKRLYALYNDDKASITFDNYKGMLSLVENQVEKPDHYHLNNELITLDRKLNVELEQMVNIKEQQIKRGLAELDKKKIMGKIAHLEAFENDFADMLAYERADYAIHARSLIEKAYSVLPSSYIKKLSQFGNLTETALGNNVINNHEEDMLLRVGVNCARLSLPLAREMLGYSIITRDLSQSKRYAKIRAIVREKN